MASIRQNTFNGIWYIPGIDARYNGELICEEKDNLWALHLTDRHNNESPTELIEKPHKYIQGKLDNGPHILLVDSEVRHAGGQLFVYDNYLLFPKYILEGIEIDSDIVELSALAFDFDDIVHWSGMCHFRYRNDSIEWQQEPDAVFEYDDHSLIVSPIRYGTMSFVPSREVHLSQSVVFKLHPASTKPLEWFLEMANRIKLLITLGLQRKIAFHELRFHQPRSAQHQENEGHLIREHPLHINLAKREEASDVHFLNHLFSFNMLKEHPEIYSAWMRHYETMKPIIDLRCLVFLYPDSPAEVVFLNLMQALETFHARFICDNPKQYSSIVNHLVNRDLKFYDDQQREDYRTYLRENTSSSFITLQARIRYLFSIERFIYVPPANKCDLKSFIKKLVDSRNYYTHYAPKKKGKAFDCDELPAVNALISVLLDYHILETINYPQGELTALIHKKFVQIDGLIGDSLY